MLHQKEKLRTKGIKSATQPTMHRIKIAHHPLKPPQVKSYTSHYLSKGNSSFQADYLLALRTCGIGIGEDSVCSLIGTLVAIFLDYYELETHGRDFFW